MMKLNGLSRARKTKILSQVFAGETIALQQLKSPTYDDESLTDDQLKRMSDEELLQLIWDRLTDQERAEYGPVHTWTDEHFQKINDRNNPT